jgi:carbon monoxide dehydrogenase subunit G
MQLSDSFTLAVPVERLWAVLTDVELIAPCVPGFKLKEISDPDYIGKMTIKVGAVTVTYDATITFVERDDDARRAVLSVKGREARGGGAVEATVTANLSEEDGRTTAEMVTDLEISGRVAQFGRGIIADVASRLTGQFVENLNSKVLAPPLDGDGDGGGRSGSDRKDAAGSPRPSAAEPAEEVLNLGALAAAPVLKRALPVALAVAAVLLLVRLLR